MKCEHCSRDFTPKQRFCSDKCRKADHKGTPPSDTSGVDDISIEPEGAETPSWE